VATRAFVREAAIFCIALAVAGAARADTMVCTTAAGVTRCEAPHRHYTITGTWKAIELISRTTRVAAG
jgi:hypothetical protein